MELRRVCLMSVSAAAALVVVAGCTSGSDGTATAQATATATQTVSSTDTVSSADPPTGSGVPATSPATGGGSGSSGNGSGPGLCTPTVMRFDVSANDPAAGSSYFEIHATNGSQSPCVTTGFPGVAFLDGNGRTILNAVRDDPSQSTTITVAPGGEITAQVKVSNGTGENRTCPTSPAFLLTLPDNTDSTKITHSTPACSATVAAFVKGSGNS